MSDRIGIRGRSIIVYARFLDAAGDPCNTDNPPTVEILDSNGLVKQHATDVGVSLAHDPGWYSFTYDIPLSGVDGYYVDHWEAKIGDETVEASFTFLVMQAGVVEADVEPSFTPEDVTFQFTECEAEGIGILMKFVKARLKNDGTRKVPDGAGGFTDEPCSIFTDDELICFLINGLSGFNAYPHFSSFTFCDQVIQTVFADIVIQGAVLLALAAQTLIEKGREFSITDNGVVFQPPAVSEILNSQYTAQLADYKEKLKMIKASCKPKPLGCGTFRVTSIAPGYLRLRHLRQRQLI